MPVLHRPRTVPTRLCRRAGDPVELAARRAEAYRGLFGAGPFLVIADALMPAHEGPPVDLHLYEMEQDGEKVIVAVTSGMSNYQMFYPDDPAPIRREIIQYLRKAEPEALMRIHGSAWIPLAAGYCLDFCHSQGPYPGKWQDAVFLMPLVEEHAEFELELGGDAMKFLWLVPLTEEEKDFKEDQGVDALLDRMEAVQLPWIFDEDNRPSLLP